MTKLLKPECEWGYTYAQLEIMFPGPELDKLGHWLRGQTGAICQGQRYNHDTKEHEPACGGKSHGMVVYPWDVERYIAGLPVID